MLSDLAAIYTCSTPGTRIRYNLLRDVSRRDYGGWGIYPDEGSHDILIEKNLIYGCQDGALFAHHNRNIIAENNILALNRDAQLLERGGIGGFRADLPRAIYKSTTRTEVPWGAYGDEHSAATCVHSTATSTGNATGEPPMFRPEKFHPVANRSEQDQRNSLVADPLFVDPEKGDFRLRPRTLQQQRLDSEPWDFSAVGPRPPGSVKSK